MSSKLYIGGMSWDTSEGKLRETFKQFGEVLDAKVIVDRFSGRSRGFGFVTFANHDDAQNAITKMDGTVLDGRTLAVNEAREEPDRRRGNRDRDFGRGGSQRRY
ncbi:MAG: RNA-binding protein [Deltaproteobacteria bacterium]|nr:RNA-binding protein [Deltaproteobacteria bacterium]